jgi:vomeronasal 2 receptor
LDLLPRHHFDPAMNEEGYNIYNAVYAVAYSIHEMNLQQIQTQPYAKGEEMVFFQWQVIFISVLYNVNNVAFLLFL